MTSVKGDTPAPDDAVKDQGSNGAQPAGMHADSAENPHLADTRGENTSCAASGGSLLLRVAGWLCRIALAAVFFYAGWAKLMEPQGFMQDVFNYHLVGMGAAFWVAMVLPPLEIALAACLLITPLARVASLATAGLCVVFLGAILSAWVRGLDITCGCFGTGGTVVPYPMLVLRSCLFIALALVAFTAMQPPPCNKSK